MAQERGEQRQLRLNIGIVAIPAKQGAQHKHVAQIVHADLASERLAVKAAAAPDAVELVPDGPVIQPGAGIGDQEAGVLWVRAARRASAYASSAVTVLA